MIAARTTLGGVVFAKSDDPFKAAPAPVHIKEPPVGAPLTVFRCADGVLRLFSGDRSVPPARNARARRAEQPREVVAIISDIMIGENVRAIRVFVNSETVNQDVPDSDPHYVTTLSFLRHGKGDAHAQHTSLPSTIVDLTDTLRNLSDTTGLSGDQWLGALRGGT